MVQNYTRPFTYKVIVAQMILNQFFFSFMSLSSSIQAENDKENQ